MIKIFYVSFVLLSLGACTGTSSTPPLFVQGNSADNVSKKDSDARTTATVKPEPSSIKRDNTELSKNQHMAANEMGDVKKNHPMNPEIIKSHVIDVYKSDTCGCCTSWIEHLKKNGFSVVVHSDNEGLIKDKMKIPLDVRSCHTGVVDGKFIEGHVPAEDIQAFLNNHSYSRAKGIAVPGMPIGSPGMEMGGKVEPYDVLLIQEDKKIVFSRHK